MDLNQLETFVRIVEERGFSRAALRLHRTQPAVSQSIRRLEEELGERLFERYARDGTLTAAGEVLLDYARRMMSLRAEAQSAVRELQTLARGRLTIAANEYTTHFLLRVLPLFRQSCPQIEIHVQRSLASRIPDEVLQRQVEFGVLSFRPESELLDARQVWEDEVLFVVDPRHAMASRTTVSVEELGAQNFVAHAVASPLRRQIFELFARHNTPLHTGVQLPSLEAVKLFVANGGGVAILPGLAVAGELARGELVQIPVHELNELRRRLWLVFRRGAVLSHPARALLGLLSDRFAAHPRATPPV